MIRPLTMSESFFLSTLLMFSKLIILVLWSDRPLMVGFIFVLSYFMVSKKMISISVP